MHTQPHDTPPRRVTRVASVSVHLRAHCSASQRRILKPYDNAMRRPGSACLQHDAPAPQRASCTTRKELHIYRQPFTLHSRCVIPKTIARQPHRATTGCLRRSGAMSYTGADSNGWRVARYPYHLVGQCAHQTACAHSNWLPAVGRYHRQAHCSASIAVA